MAVTAVLPDIGHALVCFSHDICISNISSLFWLFSTVVRTQSFCNITPASTRRHHISIDTSFVALKFNTSTLNTDDFFFWRSGSRPVKDLFG